MRLIDVDKLLNDIHRMVKESNLVYHENEIMDCIAYADIIDTDIDVEPVRHGKWKTDSDRADCLICSLCDCAFDMWKHEAKDFKYCPHCGAKMDLND